MLRENIPILNINHKITPDNGSDEVIIPVNGGEESIFKIPTMVGNLARSFLNGTITIQAPGAGICNWMYASQVSPIAEIQLYNASGTMVVDLRNANFYTDIVSKPETSRNDMLSFNTDESSQFLQRSNNEAGNVNSVQYDGTRSSVLL